MSKRTISIGFLLFSMVSFLILTIHLQNPLPQKYEELVNEFLLLKESNDNNAYDLCYFKSGYESTKCMMIEVAPILAEVKLGLV